MAIAMNLKRRLWALEQIVVPPDDDRCEACGYEPGSELKFEVSFSDDEEIDGPDVCPGRGPAADPQAVIRQSAGNRPSVGRSAFGPKSYGFQ